MNVHDRTLKRTEATVVEMPAGAALPPQDASTRRPHFVLRLLRGTLQAVVPIAVLAAAYGGYQYMKATKPEPAKQAKTERAFPVRAETVSFGNYQPTLTLFGSTVAGRQVDLRALVSGRVVATSPALREGGIVAKGDELLQIDELDYVTALEEWKAQLAETQARAAELKASRASDEASLAFSRKQLELAKADLSRAQPLARDGTVSARTVDDRRQVVLQREQAADQLANAINVWNARISQQKAIAERMASTIRRAEQRLVETDLTAPFDAYLTDVGAQVGRMVGVNDKVATLIDRNWIEARFALTDKQYGRIVAAEGSLEGRKADVHWSLGDTKFRYDARIERVGAQIDSGTGGVELFARILDPSKPTPLRPGAFVSVQLPDTEFAGVARLPATALYEGDTVYVIKDGRLDPRKVTIAAGADADLLVRGDIKEGERVLTSRISTPGGGVLVKEVGKP